MGVLIISGSPRKNGNTMELLKIFEEELYANEIETDFISLSNKKMNHCINCDRCYKKGKCALNDDFNSIYEKVLNNHGLVLGSPVYVGMPTSLLIAFVQRLTYVSHNNGHTLTRKVGGPIAVAGETGQLATLNSLVDFYLVNEMIIPSSEYWNIGVGAKKGAIKSDENGKRYIKKFAQNLAWLLKNIWGDIYEKGR
ncbi:flavodoxin family protein [Wukongibacter baidiensis]|uniref:flavodoxin family protein n=1 Tax=Wukongibacter baidiensis TaxID=1723361 RepID=UPI003D7F652D